MTIESNGVIIKQLTAMTLIDRYEFLSTKECCGFLSAGEPLTAGMFPSSQGPRVKSVCVTHDTELA